MARQSNTPVQFNRTNREDNSVIMSSGRAGLVIPVAYAPMLRGDSAAGTFALDVRLADMPKPVLNGVEGNLQVWFIPKNSQPQFAGYDEFMASYQGRQITALGQPDRDPPPYFAMVEGPALKTVVESEIFKTMGIHAVTGENVNTDLIDAYNSVVNFRLAAHSSKLELRKYTQEDVDSSVSLARAFWPTGRYSRVVPDYERALLLGALDLDVSQGTVPLKGNPEILLNAAKRMASRWVMANGNTQPNTAARARLRAGRTYGVTDTIGGNEAETEYAYDPKGSLTVDLQNISADLANHTITSTLANLDMARTVQAFAKLHASYAGNETTGFSNAETLVAELMQGFTVPQEQFSRPWLLGHKRIGFDMNERPATDGANLDKSVTKGELHVQLPISVPRTDAGGIILVTLEVLPERLYERQSDEFLHIETVQGLPDALRDVQIVEPVNIVQNRRLDAKHATPNAAYGFEPLNDVWNRSFVRLGGNFYQPDPNAPWREARSALWLAEVKDPKFTEDHFLAPANFPHDVFSDRSAPAFEYVGRLNMTINGLTQIGDVLIENNDDYQAVKDA